MTKQEESQFHCKICGKTEKRQGASRVITYSDGVCSTCLLRQKIRQLIDNCYGATNPDYPKLIAFQPMKFLNELLAYLHSQGLFED